MSMFRLTGILSFALFIGATAYLGVAGENWPQFRGPAAAGVAEGQPPPHRWGPTENVVWKTPIPGSGWSSPIVWSDRIYVTSVVRREAGEKPQPGLYRGGERPTPGDEHRWMVYAIDFESGKMVWEREVKRGIPTGPRHLKNTYASETPVTDGQHIYAYFGNVGLYCLTRDGKVVWSRPMKASAMRNGWGTAASPVLHKNVLYVVNDNDEESFLLALDKNTGKEIWRVERDEKSNWATPYIWENVKRTEIITPGTQRVRSYDLDGTLLWELSGMSSIVVPAPFAKDGLLYIASGYVGDTKRPVFAIRPGAKGDISLQPGDTENEHVAWSLPQGGPYMPSPLVYGDYYYTLYDRGFLTCHDARTGKEIYGKVRIATEAAAFTASPWAYDGKIFALSEDGDTYVIQAGAQFNLLGRNSLGELAMATPAIANGSLILRTAQHLYRIGN